MLKTKDKEKVRKFIKTLEKVLWDKYHIGSGDAKRMEEKC